MKKSFLNTPKNVYALLIVATFILYGNTLTNKYSLDDNLVLQGNSMIDKGLKGIPELFTTKYVTLDKKAFDYRPLVKLSVGIDFMLWKYNPALSHLVNLLMYALCLIILFRLLKLIFAQQENSLLLIIVILFAAHPVHTEVVASIKNRDELLSFLFSLLSAIQFLKWSENQKLKHFAFGGLLFFSAMLSKSSAIVFVALIPLMMYFTNSFTWKRASLTAATTFILGFAWSAIPLFFLAGGDRNPEFFENPLYYEQAIDIKLGVGGLTLLHYVKLLIYPWRLLYYYGYDMIPIVSVFTPLAIVGLLLHAALFVYAIILLKKKHIMGFGIMYYLIAISMFTNILKPAVGIVADRFLFNASLGFCIVLGYIFFKGIQERKKVSKKNRTLAGFSYLLIPLLVFYSWKTIDRNKDWKDAITLYKTDMPYLEKSFKAHMLYSNAMFKEIVRTSSDGKLAQRNRDWTKETVQILTRSVEIYDQYPNAWNTLGAIHFMILKDNVKAKDYFFRAFRLNPYYTEVIFNIGFCYENLNMPDSALYYYDLCISVDANYVNPYNRKLYLLFAKNQINEGLEFNQQIMKQFPESDAPFINLGNYYLMTGDTASAFGQWEIAIEKIPNNPSLLDALIQYNTMIGNKEKVEKYSTMLRNQQKNRKKTIQPPVFL
jgi:protein O-mannosyl-transferase